MDEKIIFLKPKSIKPYENNAKIHNDDQIEALIKSISEFGFTNPVLIDESHNCIAGHGRLIAAERMGLNEVPCRVIKGLSDEQKRALILADNKIAEMAEWDYDKLEMELNSIADIDMADFGFDLEIDERIEVQEDNYEIDEHIPTEPRSVRGGLYKLGDHVLMCGDSTSKDDIAKLMGGNKADLVATDPPYNTGMKPKEEFNKRLALMFDDSYTEDEWRNFLEVTTENIYDYLKDDSVAYIFSDWRRDYQFIPFLKDKFTLSNIIVWDKEVHGLGSDYKYTYELINVCKKGKPNIHNRNGDREYQDVWHIQRQIGRNESHATAKPVEVMNRIVSHASDKRDIVLDLFGGSGTTLIACEQLGRRCYMMELDPNYCDVIIDRWETYTGRKAECLKK